MGFTTKALHTQPLAKDAHGAMRFPIYQSSAFEFEKYHKAIIAKEAKEKGMDPKLVEKKYFGAKQDSEPWQKRAAKIGNINL